VGADEGETHRIRNFTRFSVRGCQEDDRDVNAAKNILKFGLTKVSNRTGTAVNQPELPMIALSLKVEAPS